MNLKKLQRITSQFKSDHLLLKIGFLAMMVFSYFSYQSAIFATQNVRTIVVPLNQAAKFWVSGDDADEKYIVNIGTYVADLLYATTAANIDQRFAKILTLVNSENYTDIKAYLKNKATLIKRYKRNAWSFRYLKTFINKKTHEITIIGGLTRWKNSGKEKEKQTKLIIGYDINNANFSITKLDESKEK